MIIDYNTYKYQHVMIVDDDESIRKSLSMVLKKKGFDVVMAETGNEAIALAKKYDIDIAILDIRMPDIEGFDLFEPLKSIHPDIGVILVTGYASVETAKQALKKGATAYITKPLDIEELLKVIQDFTDKQRLEKEKRKIEQELIFERNLFNTFFENIPDAVYFKDREGRFVRVSKSLAELFQTTPENIIGKTDQDFYTKDIATAKLKNDTSVVETGMPIINLEEKDTINNKERWVRTTMLQWMDSTGAIIGLFGLSRDITERKVMEEKIRESEVMFRTLFEASTEGILIANIKTKKFIYANPALCKMLGYSLEELLKMNVSDIHPKDALDHVLSEFDAQAQGIKTMAHGIPCLKEDKSIIYTDINTGKAVLNGTECNIGFFTDITERKLLESRQKAQHAIRECIWRMNKPEHIETVAVTFRDALKDMGIQFNFFGINIIQVSEEIPQVYAYEYSDKEKNISKPGLDNIRVLIKIWKDGVPVYRKDIQKNDELSEKKDVESNFRNIKIRSILDVPFSHGTVAINSTQSNAFTKTDIETLVYMAQVLSEGYKRLEDLQNIEQYTKNLEQMIEERTKDLNRALNDTEQARENVDNILKAVADGLIVTDEYNRVVMMNKVAEDLLNVRFSEMFNRPIDFAIEEKTLREKLVETLNRKNNNCRFDFSLSGVDQKSIRILRARTSIIIGKDGEKKGIVMSINDVTHEREVDRMKTEFISTAAHELRTPLTSIVGFSKILASRDDITNEEQKRFLSYINNQGMKLSRIVSDLLDISRIESGKGLELNIKSCNISDLIKQVLPYYYELSSIHTFELNIPDEPIKLNLDSDKIEQVLKNILSNAVKYSPEGGTILLSLKENDYGYTVSIEDDGIGMTDEQVEKIFDKFYRANTTNSAVEGTGLGMVIVKYIVEAHGGTINVESKYGIGTTVSFTLPYAL